jgi:hypothetical protein
MNATEELVFRDGGNKIVLCNDQILISIGLGLLKLNYTIDEIASVRTKSGFFSTAISLVLNDGTETQPISYVSKATWQRLKSEIEERIDRYRAALGVEGEIVSFGCSILGGSGIDLACGQTGVAAFDSEAFHIIINFNKRLVMPVATLTACTIGGDGTVTTDGGFIGGGFGIEGAALGIAAATLLNSIAKTSTTNTLLHLTWPKGEIFLHTNRFEPEILRRALSNTFTTMAAAREQRLTGGADLAIQLERLAALHTSGALSADEFSVAKAKVLSTL